MPRRWLDHIIPYVLLAIIGTPLGLFLWDYVNSKRHGDKVSWLNPWALVLLSGCALIALVAFHLRVRRAPTFAHARVDELAMARPGLFARLVSVPMVLRMLALACIVVALARPRTYKKQEIIVEGIDIMIVLDLSKSMEERDLGRNRLDAGQRTIRRFLKKRKHDRIGLVVFAQEAMTQCPLTLDYKSLDQIVADLAIGDVPELGTAIGDALGLALAALRRSEDPADAHVPDGPPGFKIEPEPDPKAGKADGDKFKKTRSKVVILLSDGDSNWTTKFTPREAKLVAQKMGVKVFTILLGKERRILFAGATRSTRSCSRKSPATRVACSFAPAPTRSSTAASMRFAPNWRRSGAALSVECPGTICSATWSSRPFCSSFSSSVSA